MTTPEDRSAFNPWLEPLSVIKGARVSACWLADGRSLKNAKENRT